MKTIYPTEAAVEVAENEMKQKLNEVVSARRTEDLWGIMIKEFGRQFIAAAIPGVNTPLNLNKWLYGHNI